MSASWQQNANANHGQLFWSILSFSIKSRSILPLLSNSTEADEEYLQERIKLLNSSVVLCSSKNLTLKWLLSISPFSCDLLDRALEAIRSIFKKTLFQNTESSFSQEFILYLKTIHCLCRLDKFHQVDILISFLFIEGRLKRPLGKNPEIQSSTCRRALVIAILPGYFF